MIRVAVLGALHRLRALNVEQVLTAVQDVDPRVRKRGLELACVVTGRGVKTSLIEGVRTCLSDPDPLVVDAACWALGERRARSSVPDLITCSSDHQDPRCREAAVAALGAIGDPLGLPAILDRLHDKPAVRRRVVVALASFEGSDVDAALEQCRVDHDWQVRQAVEMLERTSPLL
ncbi:MAG: HEAT repeat domain-containing protein [Actinomycetota bacterium]